MVLRAVSAVVNAMRSDAPRRAMVRTYVDALRKALEPFGVCDLILSGKAITISGQPEADVGARGQLFLKPPPMMGGRLAGAGSSAPWVPRLALAAVAACTTIVVSCASHCVGAVLQGTSAR
mgnify:CR=1 FL=1